MAGARAGHSPIAAPDVYERLGIATIINAKGPATRLSGGIMAPEVAAAMAAASQACVDMTELQARASDIIADVTGAEAGLVTAGAAAALLLGTAACITGLDAGRMNRLPDTRGMPDRVVMVRSQRNSYDHAIRTAGARIVEVGLPDRSAGAGLRDAEPFEIGAAITARTALVHWVAGGAARPPLAQVVEVAHAAGVPVLVDAAAELPPASNLERFIAEGADLVAFSGGKAIGGPQASGILCGRRELIMAAALQQQDLDILPEHWQPPRRFIDRARLEGLPRHGIGRPCKVGKEEVVGLLVALERFVADDPALRRVRWRQLLIELVDGLGELRNGVAVTLRDQGEVPLMTLELDPAEAGIDAWTCILRLEAATPSIRADPSEADAGRVLFNPISLRPEHPAAIAAALRAILA